MLHKKQATTGGKFEKVNDKVQAEKCHLGT